MVNLSYNLSNNYSALPVLQTNIELYFHDQHLLTMVESIKQVKSVDDVIHYVQATRLLHTAVSPYYNYYQHVNNSR